MSGFRRRVSVSSLVHLERQGRGSVGGGGPFLSEFPLAAEPIPFLSYGPGFYQDRLGEGSSIFTREGGSRASSFTFSGVLQSDIFSNEGLRVVETGD